MQLRLAIASLDSIASPLKQLTIGMKEADDSIGSVHFTNTILGRIDRRDGIIRT